MSTIKLGSRGDEVKRLQTILSLIPDGIFGKLTEEALNAWKVEHGLPADGIFDETTMLVMMPDELKAWQTVRRIDEIIVHCTATPEGRDYTVEQIRKQHKAQGWSDIGYHYVVYRNGKTLGGRDVRLVGSHCQGRNSHSIGVVYVGGCDKNMKPKDTRTPEQKVALIHLLKTLRILYPGASIHGHNEYAAKACPSFDAKKEYKDL